MATFCIPKKISARLQEVAKRGEIKIDQLYEMTSDERRSFFNDYVQNEDVAKGINAGFENAMASANKSALKTWVKNTFSVKQQKSSKYKSLISKIESLSDSELLTPENRDMFLQDLVAEKLGATVTADEAQQIDKLSKELTKEFDEGLDEYGIPSENYWKKRQEMDNYLQSLVPYSSLGIATSTIGRGNMLASVKSPVTNIIGNTTQAIEQSFERRISSSQYSGAVSKKIVKDYVKKANKIYSQSGFDVTRMQDYSDGKRTLGEKIIHSQGKGAIRKIGRVYEDKVFKNLLGKPDVYFSSVNFADSANLASTKIAKQEGLKGKQLKSRAEEIFKDATSISPTSVIGETVRSQAIADATLATFTDDTVYSSVALAIRDVLNKASGDVRIGDQIMPFVKTPANVVGMTLDSAGLGAVRGIFNLPSAVQSMKLGNPEPMRGVMRGFTRSALGITGAFILSSLIDIDDFIGQYPTSEKERELLRTKNASTNSIKIGDKWISLDYFGFLGAPLVGLLYARKYGNDLPSYIYSYATGAGTQALQFPGLEEFSNVYKFMQDISPEGYIDKEELPGIVSNDVIDFIRARIIPGITADIAKSMDEFQREVDYKNPTEKFKAGIPVLREELKEKYDIFGEILKGEPWYSQILFGSRVKTARDNEIVQEITRLDQAGYLPSVTNPAKTSSRVKTFKEQVSEDKYDKFLESFRNSYKKEVERTIKSNTYKRMSDEEKKGELDKIKNKQLDIALKKYGYKKPR